MPPPLVARLPYIIQWIYESISTVTKTKTCFIFINAVNASCIALRHFASCYHSKMGACR